MALQPALVLLGSTLGEQCLQGRDRDTSDSECCEDGHHRPGAGDECETYETRRVGDNAEIDRSSFAESRHDPSGEDGLNKHLHQTEEGQGNPDFDGAPVETLLREQNPRRAGGLADELYEAESRNEGHHPLDSLESKRRRRRC